MFAIRAALSSEFIGHVKKGPKSTASNLGCALRCGFSRQSVSQSASEGTVTMQKLKFGMLKEEMRHELHKLTRIDSVACQKIKSVTISEIRVKGFVPVVRMLQKSAFQRALTASLTGRWNFRRRASSPFPPAAGSVRVMERRDPPHSVQFAAPSRQPVRRCRQRAQRATHLRVGAHGGRGICAARRAARNAVGGIQLDVSRDDLSAGNGDTG